MYSFLLYLIVAITLCQSLTAVSFRSTSLVSLSLGGCRAITSLELTCPYLEHVSLDGCDHLERASFSPVSHHLTDSLFHLMSGLKSMTFNSRLRTFAFEFPLKRTHDWNCSCFLFLYLVVNTFSLSVSCNSCCPIHSLGKHYRFISLSLDLPSAYHTFKSFKIHCRLVLGP